MRTALVPSLAVLALGTSLAWAQNYTQVREEDAAGFDLAQGFTLDDLNDADVVDAQGTELGEVEHLLADDVGEITAVVVDLESDGDRDVVVELTNLKPSGNGQLTTELTAERLGALPAYQSR